MFRWSLLLTDHAVKCEETAKCRPCRIAAKRTSSHVPYKLIGVIEWFIEINQHLTCWETSRKYQTLFTYKKASATIPHLFSFTPQKQIVTWAQFSHTQEIHTANWDQQIPLVFVNKHAITIDAECSIWTVRIIKREDMWDRIFCNLWYDWGFLYFMRVWATTEN